MSLLVQQLSWLDGASQALCQRLALRCALSTLAEQHWFGVSLVVVEYIDLMQLVCGLPVYQICQRRPNNSRDYADSVASVSDRYRCSRCCQKAWKHAE